MTRPKMDAPALLTRAEVAERLGISTRLLSKLVAAGDVTCYRIGSGRGRVRFDPRDVDAYLASVREGGAS